MAKKKKLPDRLSLRKEYSAVNTPYVVKYNEYGGYVTFGDLRGHGRPDLSKILQENVRKLIAAKGIPVMIYHDIPSPARYEVFGKSSFLTFAENQFGVARDVMRMLREYAKRSFSREDYESIIDQALVEVHKADIAKLRSQIKAGRNAKQEVARLRALD